jgi:hypothetical protein
MSPCALAAIDRRLEDAHRLWHRAAENYFDPEEFRVNAQLLIQTLRTVTFILQSSKSKIPDFEAWYAPWQQRFKDDPLMYWAKEARNKIEKQGDLASKSFIRAEIVASYLGGPSLEVEAHLFDDPSALFRVIPKEVLRKQVFKHGVLRIERRWVANDLPEYELLDALAHTYGRLSALVHDAHRQAGLSVDDLELAGRLPCMIGHSEPRALLISLATGDKLELKQEPVEIDFAQVEQRYGTPPDLRNADTVESLTKLLFNNARRLFLMDGYHESLIFFLRGRQIVDVVRFEPENRQQKYLLMRQMAHEAVRRSADGVALIGEVWTAEKTADPFEYPSDLQEGRGEGLSLMLATKGGRTLHLSAVIGRDGGQVRLGETTEEAASPMMFAPFYEVWGVSPPWAASS